MARVDLNVPAGEPCASDGESGATSVLGSTRSTWDRFRALIRSDVGGVPSPRFDLTRGGCTPPTSPSARPFAWAFALLALAGLCLTSCATKAVPVVAGGVAELKGVHLAGQVNETAGSVDLMLTGQLNVTKEGGRVRVLEGGAALTDATSGDGWRAELVHLGNGSYAYDLVGERVGVLPVSLAFAVPAHEDGDWRVVNFQMPAGEVVPLRLTGLAAAGVEFNASGTVVPSVATGAGAAGTWQGYLPGDGLVTMAWRHTQKAAEGSLFFTSSEQTDVRVGAGLLRQASLLTFRVLQGKLPSIRLTLEGPGEILAVEGANVVGWKVVPSGKDRVLEVNLSRPFEGEGQLLVRSQAALGSFPVTAEPLRLTPEGTVRHSGEVRVANSGAVRLEVTGIQGMMQLAPGQFLGAAVEGGARQVFVYRFPAAAHTYQIAADQILPEVVVS